MRGAAPSDLSAWDRVLLIGPVRGCATALLGPGGWWARGPDPRTAYLLLGDLIGEGDENARLCAAVLPWLDQPGVWLLRGRAEAALAAAAPPPPSHLTRAIGELRDAGLLSRFTARCAAAPPTLTFDWRAQRVQIDPAGSPVVCLRSDQGAPPACTEGSLDGRPEHGGELRALALDGAGWSSLTARNPRFVSLPDRLRAGRLIDLGPVPTWTCAPPETSRLSHAELHAAATHPLVKLRVQPDQPELVAINFTRDAFLHAAWDEVTLRARGLFVDLDTHEIVARSYDKFFEVGERSETRLDRLADALAYPVHAYVKENGYLGILGYHPRRDALVWASKSATGSESARWFEAIVRAQLGAEGLERARRYLRDTCSSMVFEVIDPTHDPHLIAYDRAHAVLLDVVRRAPRYESLPYDQLVTLARALGLLPKRLAAVLPDARALHQLARSSAAVDYTWSGAPIEGFVIEDRTGLQIKIKLDFYQFWKRMRSLKDRVLAVRGTALPLQRDVAEPRVHAFFEWCLQQPDEVLRQDLIAVREAFLRDVPPEQREQAPAAQRAHPATFARSLEWVAAHLAQGGALKPQLANRLLRQAASDDACLHLLRERGLAVELVRVAPPGDARSEVGLRLNLGLDEAAAER